MTLTVPAGLIGFPQAQRFALVAWGGDDSPFRLLRSLDDEGLAFVVVPPELFFPDYEPELEVGDDDVVLVIVTVPDRVQDATANLLGPLVVDTATGVGSQVVLAPERWPSRRPLVATVASPAA